MNLVTGLWGMNVNVPGQEAAGLNWFFGVSLPAERRTLGGKHPTDAPLCSQILGCLAAFAVVGAFLTYRVSRACSSSTSPCAMLMASSPCSSLSGDEDLALASLAETEIPLVPFHDGPLVGFCFASFMMSCDHSVPFVRLCSVDSRCTIS